MPTTKSPSKRRAKRVAPTRGVKASVFIEAARFLAQEGAGTGSDCCCFALDYAITGNLKGDLDWGDSLSHRFLNATINPNSKRICWYRELEETDNEVRMARTLGLLLCAELVKDGFTPDNWTL